ncbi:conserved hypothetical protein [Sphingomonas sp. EC-HK361]|uniref:hypothetical protein n=1 Tax=Sphingomonas sp. EC-HK361 TaxID=2038397 RepID=UPI001253C73D|nr:conserved hypothetical protein [Sphingomonas sp. EC-HK361]
MTRPHRSPPRDGSTTQIPFGLSLSKPRPSSITAGRTGVGAALLLLAACARQVPSAVNHAADTPGFLLGLWHGFIFPVAWVLSLFVPEIAIYAVPNDGGWYDFGYFVGIVFLGVGARSTRTVYVTRRARR